jgi:hypothetical protein
VARMRQVLGPEHPSTRRFEERLYRESVPLRSELRGGSGL